MNARTFAAALYLILFTISILNMAALPSRTLSEIAPTAFSSVISSLIGVLIALWLYQDGENIKLLRDGFTELEKKFEMLKKET